jgi:hypothetical protein
MKPGDKVAYSVQWLKSIGEPHGELAHARGVITSIDAIGPRLKLARIDWGDPDIPERVNLVNLAKVGPNRRFCNVD